MKTTTDRNAIWDFESMRVSIPISEEQKKTFEDCDGNVIWILEIRKSSNKEVE